jgi:RNA polymerase sigma factor (sigma-70 family)
VGIDAIPPPASGLPARLVLGPALRGQSDRRLVRLVREGYESAFEEIVRRYRRPLDRFAAGIVGGRSEDVTQDSFRKALEALRHGDSEMELRPWLYRIVRNTALNDLRDRPPAAAELVEDLVGGARSAAAEAEERAEVAALTARLRALPENQRAALVMRELEGMSHEEIAAALGISGGAARQAIARARTAVRSGFGALVPLPLLRALAGGGDGAAEAAAAGGAGAAAGGAAIGGASVAGSGAAAISGVGALKVGLATVVVAGSLGAGVAIQHHGGDHRSNPPTAAPSAPGGPSADGVRSISSPAIAEIDDHGSRGGHDFGDDHGGEGPRGHGRDHRGHKGSGRDDDGHGDANGGPGPSGGGPGPSGSGQDGDGSGSGRGGPSGDSHRGGPGPSGPDDSTSSGHSGSDSGGGDRSRHGGSGGGSGDGSGGSGKSGSGDGSGGSGSGSSTSTRGGHGSDDATESVVGTETAATSTSSGSESSSSGSGSSGSPGSGEGSGSSGDSSITSGDSSSSSGSSGGPSPSLDSALVTDDGSGSGSGGGSGSSGGS